MNLTIINIL